MIEAKDIAVLARNIVGQAGNEARIRCAIGRAYYAAFHYCQIAADVWCGPLSPGEEKEKGMHEKLYARLQGHSKLARLDAGLRKIAELAKNLRNLRVQADYYLGDTLNQKDLTRGLKYLKEIEQEVEKLS